MAKDRYWMGTWGDVMFTIADTKKSAITNFRDFTGDDEISYEVPKEISRSLYLRASTKFGPGATTFYSSNSLSDFWEVLPGEDPYKRGNLTKYLDALDKEEYERPRDLLRKLGVPEDKLEEVIEGPNG